MIAASSIYFPFSLNSTVPPVEFSSPMMSLSISASFPSFWRDHSTKLTPRFSVDSSTATVVSVWAVFGNENSAVITEYMLIICSWVTTPRLFFAAAIRVMSPGCINFIFPPFALKSPSIVSVSSAGSPFIEADHVTLLT
ncbi:hypothetical protein DSECCO2_572130 [anaerobic digester metagenome]